MSRLWPVKWPISGVRASTHPQHSEPEPRVARGSQTKKGARRSSEPLCVVAVGAAELETAANVHHENGFYGGLAVSSFRFGRTVD
jgi:hypothetical protein